MELRNFSRFGFTLIELLVVIAIISILVSLLLPGIQAARETARRTQCQSNLMQLALAVQNYEATFEVLPPGIVDYESPIKSIPQGYHFSWLVQILPYIEQSSVHRHMSFSVGVYALENSTVRMVPISLFVCPSDSQTPNTQLPQSNYAGCNHHEEAPIADDNTGVFFLNSSVRPNEILDGRGNTIFIGEKLGSKGDLGWASGTRATLRNTGSKINSGPFALLANEDTITGNSSVKNQPSSVGGFGSSHPGGALFAFGDGSVRFVSDNIDRKLFERLGDRSDGQLILSEF